MLREITSQGQIKGLNVAGISDFTKIVEILLAADAVSIDLTSIPQTYTHLRLVLSLRNTGTNANVRIMMNGDATAANYGSWNSAGSNAGTSLGAQIGVFVPGSGAAAGIFGGQWIDLADYRRTDRVKVLWTSHGGSPLANANFVFSQWASTAAINRLTITPEANNLLAGSHATLYGIN